ELFSAVRARVGDALGLGVNVVNARTWRHHAHPRLLSALVGFAWTAASTGSVVVCVSPFTAYRRDPAAFAADTGDLPARWRWVVLEAPGEVCRARMAGRGWGMDTDKLERWRAYERSQVGLGVPEGAIRVSSDLAASEYPAVAEALATALGWDQEGPRGRAGDQLRGAAGRSGRR
ncbi:MAG: hypothetical protein ACRD0L_15825, partial [Acidimicrobiales bacterium]